MPYPPAHLFQPNEFQKKLIKSAFRSKLVVAETAVRTGKSGGIGFFHRQQCKLNPGVSGILGCQSFNWYRRVMHSVCKELFAKEAVYHGTDHIWTFPKYDDAKVVIVSADNMEAMEGITAGWYTIDESQDIPYAFWEAVEFRVSDKRAKYPHGMICGVPEFGSWPEILAKRTEGAILLDNVPTEVNAHNILSGYADKLKARISPEEYERKVNGARPVPKGRAYSGFLAELYAPSAYNQGGSLIYHEYNPELPTYAGVDYGRKSAVTFRQKLPSGQSVIFAELALDNLSTEALGLRMLDIAVPRARKEPTDNRILLDKVTSDPTPKDVETLRNVLGCVVHSSFKTVERDINYGVKLVNGMLLNAHGKRELLVSHDLYSKTATMNVGQRSIVLSLIRYKYPEHKEGRPISETPVKDGVDDHSSDALRYDVVLDKRGGPAFQIEYR